MKAQELAPAFIGGGASVFSEKIAAQAKAPLKV
jgi:hypothetical protein